MKLRHCLLSFLVLFFFSFAYAEENDEYNALEDLLSYLDAQGVEYEVHFDIDREPTEEDVPYTNIAGYLNLDADGYLDCDLEWVWYAGENDWLESVHSYHDPYGSGYDHRHYACYYGDSCLWTAWTSLATINSGAPSYTTLPIYDYMYLCDTWSVFKVKYMVHDFFWTYMLIGGNWVYVKVYYDYQYCYTPNICTFDW